MKKMCIILTAAIFNVGMSAPVSAKKSAEKNTELVTYATGPAGETNPDVLEIRPVETEKPDSDGVAALKTVGNFIVEFLSLPFDIVKAIWETVAD